MTPPIPRDRLILKDALNLLEEATRRASANRTVNDRLRILEGAAALIGGFDLSSFDRVVDNRLPHELLPVDVTLEFAWPLVKEICSTSLHPSLALAALGETDFTPVQRRRQGHFLTDSRLAQGLAMSVQDKLKQATSILDPACGAGTLLVASALAATEGMQERALFIRSCVWGVDRSQQSIGAARAALASLTSDLEAIGRLSRHLKVEDSLTAGWTWWNGLVSGGFDVVIGNPPWEKLKISRHEHALNDGLSRLYGEGYESVALDEEKLHLDRHETLSYVRQVTSQLYCQGPGEADLYKMFVELGARLTSPLGTLAFLVPAGLIRNSGSHQLREWLFGAFNTVIRVMDNRSSYFAIDSRFKFLQLIAQREEGRSHGIEFATIDSLRTNQCEVITSTREELRNLSPSLALPELRNRQDWDLFSRLHLTLGKLGEDDTNWRPRFYREIDMTNERPKFLDAASLAEGIAVVEGRMVHQHCAAAKRYIRGRGRSATWEVQHPLQASIAPQWRIREADLSPSSLRRISRHRAGFCDVTGQTNERTVLAAVIPPDVVCGNKVPTIDFPCEARTYAWVGVANSVVFDWLVRRSVSTTLNFFILRSVPMPKWSEEDSRLLRVARLATELSTIDSLEEPRDLQLSLRHRAEIRAEIEVLTAQLYAITVEEFDQLLRDFPQIDREQTPLIGEPASTITRDAVVSKGYGWADGVTMSEAVERVKAATANGAIPFVPNQHARAFRRAG